MHLNPPDVDKFTFSEEIDCHKERPVCVLVKVIKMHFLSLNMKFR